MNLYQESGLSNLIWMSVKNGHGMLIYSAAGLIFVCPTTLLDEWQRL